MPFKEMKSAKYIYLMYVRKTDDDFIKFRNACNRYTGGAARKLNRDIIIDFGNMQVLNSAENGVLRICAKRLTGSHRKLILLTQTIVKHHLCEEEYSSLPNVIIRENKMEQAPSPTKPRSTVPVEEPTMEEPPATEVSEKKPSPAMIAQPSKSSLEMITCTECNYTLWATAAELEKGLPLCPNHHRMNTLT